MSGTSSVLISRTLDHPVGCVDGSSRVVVNVGEQNLGATPKQTADLLHQAERVVNTPIDLLNKKIVVTALDNVSCDSQEVEVSNAIACELPNSLLGFLADGTPKLFEYEATRKTTYTRAATRGEAPNLALTPTIYNGVTSGQLVINNPSCFQVRGVVNFESTAWIQAGAGSLPTVIAEQSINGGAFGAHMNGLAPCSSTAPIQASIRTNRVDNLIIAPFATGTAEARTSFFDNTSNSVLVQHAAWCSAHITSV